MDFTIEVKDSQRGSNFIKEANKLQKRTSTNLEDEIITFIENNDITLERNTVKSIEICFPGEFKFKFRLWTKRNNDERRIMDNMSIANQASQVISNQIIIGILKKSQEAKELV